MELGMKNYMEDIVAEKVPTMLKELGVCDCQRCRLDVMAFVLNKIPPKYVVTLKGNIYAKLALLQSQFDVDLITHITRAAVMIQENPRHGDE